MTDAADASPVLEGGPAPDGGVAPLVVVGDSLLDVDLDGVSERLCPDAPVPVVDVRRQSQRPGGAALAAVLAARTGVPVVLVTALGQDRSAETLLDLLDGLPGGRVTVCRLPLTGGTVRKTRVAAAGRLLLRLDDGTGRAQPGPVPEPVRQALAGAGAVLVSDYGRGVTELPELRRLLREATARVPVVWDPHPKGATPVPGCHLITPNAAEAVSAGGVDEPALAAEVLARRWQAAAVAVTVGRRGAVLFDRTGETLTEVPVPRGDDARTPASEPGTDRLDTCGAGDQFAAAAAIALRTGSTPRRAVEVAVAAASDYVHAGAAATVSVSRSTGGFEPGIEVELDVELKTLIEDELDTGSDGFAFAEQVRARGGRLVATGGCFDLLHPGHLRLLRQARRLGDALVVCLNSDDSVRRAKGPGRPVMSQQDRTAVLSALVDVDAVVVFDSDTPVEVLRRLQPDVWVKGADYAGRPVPERSVVENHGGRVEFIPLVPGQSSTRLTHRATAAARISHPATRTDQQNSIQTITQEAS